MKQLLRKALLVLLGGIFMSTAAWADGEIAFTNGNRIGAEDNSTPWYGQASEIIAVGPHQRLTLKFKTYTATDGQLGGTTWHDQLTHALNIWDGQEQNLYMKGCGYGWKTHGGTINDPADYNVNTAGVFNQKTYGWAADYRTMIGTGADVVMYIERNGSELSISQTFTTSGGDKYYHYFSGTFGLANNNVWLQMTVERAHIDITADKELTDASITGTLIGLMNNTGAFKAGANKDFTIGANKTLELNFKSFTNKFNLCNGWGIEMQYGVGDGATYFDLTPGNKNMWGALNESPTTDWGTWPTAESDAKEAMDGATVNLTIARSGATVTVTAVHVTAANVTHTITHRFTPTAADFATSDITFRFAVEGGHLDLLPVTAAINEYGWATFVSDYDLDFSKAQEGLKAYAVTGHESSAITKDAITGAVPAGTPLLLNGDASTNYTIPVALTNGTAPTTNLLKAGTGAEVSQESGKTKYALSVNGGVACFKKITTAREIPVGKAYLEFNETISAREFFALDESEVTGISSIENGKMTIDNAWYSLDGRKYNGKPSVKGVYVNNGRKVVLK